MPGVWQTLPFSTHRGACRPLRRSKISYRISQYVLARALCVSLAIPLSLPALDLCLSVLPRRHTFCFSLHVAALSLALAMIHHLSPPLYCLSLFAAPTALPLPPPLPSVLLLLYIILTSFVNAGRLGTHRAQRSTASAPLRRGLASKKATPAAFPDDHYEPAGDHDDTATTLLSSPTAGRGHTHPSSLLPVRRGPSRAVAKRPSSAMSITSATDDTFQEHADSHHGTQSKPSSFSKPRREDVGEGTPTVYCYGNMKTWSLPDESDIVQFRNGPTVTCRVSLYCTLFAQQHSDLLRRRCRRDLNRSFAKPARDSLSCLQMLYPSQRRRV